MTVQKSALSEARSAAVKLLELMETTQDISIERCLMMAKRLARLTRDTDAQVWLDFELSGYPKQLDISSLGECQRYAYRCGRISDDGAYYVTSLPAMEGACRALWLKMQSAAPKAAAGSAENYTVAGATQAMFNKQLEVFDDIKRQYTETKGRFAAFQGAIHSYATDTLISIEFGDVAEQIFDELRYEVDSFVRTRVPEAAEKLVAIAERLAEGNSEARAEALTSCRRLFLSLADALFPARAEEWKSKDGKSRKVGLDQYKNRLIAFIEQNISSDGTKALLENDLEHMCARLDAVYEKTNKGVHADVTLDEARLTIIQAYIFMGELARVENKRAVTG